MTTSTLSSRIRTKDQILPVMSHDHHMTNDVYLPLDLVNIKVLNAGAWSRSSERVPVSLPTEVCTPFIHSFIHSFVHVVGGLHS